MFLELKSGYYLKWIGVSLVLTASCISESGKKRGTVSNESGAPAKKLITTELRSADSLAVTNPDKSNPEMVFFPGGTIKICSVKGRDIEQPVFTATVQPFWIDKNLVTVKKFRKFVKETGYKTDADKFGNSLVFDGKYLANVWQWTETKLMPYPGSSFQNRAGPDENSRVLRGGSFMFNEYGSLSNSVWFRSSNTIETYLFNMVSDVLNRT